MSHTPDSRDASLPFAIQKQIDAICDRFEAAWKAGNDPRLEEYLDELSGSARTGLLSGLLAVEIEYRRDAEGNRVPDDLILAAHPELFEEVTEALQKLNQPQTTESHVAAPSPDAAPSDDLPPDSIPGYTILKELNRGGQGVVYQAIQKSTHRKVALKVMLEGPFAGPDSRHRFEREVALVGSLRHPNIVPVFDSGVAQGRFFYAMEYVRGKSLKKYVQSEKLSLEQTLRLFKKVCDAVNCAHQRGVIHRDLKPTNILVDDTGEPHVLDFGLAKVGGAEVDGDSRSMLISVTGQVIGTLQYMCPEQAAGRPDQVDMRSDVYALGVILYELLTGTYPYDVKAQMADVLANILKAEPRRPSTIGRQINDEVETIILKTLSKEKDRRYDTAGALGRDIEHYLAGEPIDAKRDSALYVLRKTLRRYKVPAGVAAGFVVLVTVAAVAMSILYGQARSLSERLDVSLRKEQGERKVATDARDEAERQRQAAETAEELAQRRLYVSDMNVAGQAWENNDISLMEYLLRLHGDDSKQPQVRGFEWSFLRHLSEKLETTPRIASKENSSVAFSKDGNTLAVGHTHGPVTIWEMQNDRWTEKRTYGDVDLRRWDTFIAFSPDESNGKIIAYPSKNTVRLLNLTTEVERQFPERHESAVWAVAFSNDGRLLASASWDGKVIVWDAETGSAMQTIEGHLGGVRSVAFSPTEPLLASGSTDDTIRLWQFEESNLVGVLEGHSNDVWFVAFSPDGKMLASGSSDNTVRLWDLETEETVATFYGHRDEVRSVAFAPDQRQLASGSRDRTVKLWNIDSHEEVITLRGHPGAANGVVFSPRGGTLVSAGSDRAVMLWDAQSITNRDLMSVPGIVPYDVRSLAFLPTEDLEVVVRYDVRRRHSSSGYGTGFTNTLLFWNLETGDVHRQPLPRPICEMAIFASGRLIAGALDNGRLQLWRLSDERAFEQLKSLRLPAKTSSVTALNFSLDGKRLIAGTREGAVCVWDIADDEAIFSCMDAHATRVASVVFSPDNNTFASASWDKSHKLWRLNQRGAARPIREFVHASLVTRLAFSSNGKMLAVGTEDGSPISVYRMDEIGAERTTLVGHSFGIVALAFCDDDRGLFSAGVDGVIKLWDVPTERQRLMLDGHTTAFTWMDLSKDGTVLAAVDRSNTIHVWRAPREERARPASQEVAEPHR